MCLNDFHEDAGMLGMIGILGGMGPLATFGFGCLGVLLLNFVYLFELSKISPIDRQVDFKEGLYWADFFGRPIVGGVLAWVYWFGGEEMGPILTMNIGITAPIILKAMAKVAPSEPPARTN